MVEVSFHNVKNIKFFSELHDLSTNSYALTIEVENDDTRLHITLFTKNKEVLEKLKIN